MPNAAAFRRSLWTRLVELMEVDPNSAAARPIVTESNGHITIDYGAKPTNRDFRSAWDPAETEDQFDVTLVDT